MQVESDNGGRRVIVSLDAHKAFDSVEWVDDVGENVSEDVGDKRLQVVSKFKYLGIYVSVPIAEYLQRNLAPVMGVLKAKISPRCYLKEEKKRLDYSHPGAVLLRWVSQVQNSASHLHSMTSPSGLHTAAPAQAYFVCPVEGRGKYCSAQAPERSERPGACALQYFALPSTGKSTVRLRRSGAMKTRRGRPLMKMGGAGADLRHPFDQTAAGPPLGNIGGLSTALQNAVDKPLMTVTEQKTKVPEVTKPSSSQATAASLPGSSPSPPVNGGNNAKRVAVPNGQPPSTARYMPREVPPRFRCQQDHKVLLKRGQPPPASCMLLGGGAGTPPSSSAPGTSPGNAQPGTGALLPGESGPATDSSGAAATSNYANSTWGSGAPSSSGPNANPPHAWDKVIVDGSDMEEWPCIAGVDAEPPSDNATDNNSASNPASEKGPPQGSATNHKGRGGQGQQQQQPGSECIQGVWKADPKAKPVPSSNPATEGVNRLGNWRNMGGSERTGPASGFSNFNPNTNPAAWPALVQESSRKGNPEPDGSFSSAQLGPTGPSSREQQSKMENAGAGFGASGREPATTHHTDGPKNGNTNSTNSISSNPLDNKGTAFGAGDACRGSDLSAQSTGERKNGGVGTWGTARGQSVTGDANSGHGNSGNNGRERDDARKVSSSHRPNGSRGDSWDNNKSGGNGSWGYGPQADPSEVKWGEGNKMVAGGVSQGEWKQPSGQEDLKVGDWGGSSQGNSSTGAWDNQKGHSLSENQGNSSSSACWGRSPSSAGSEAGGQSTGSNPKAGGSGDSLNSCNRRSHRPTLPDSQDALKTLLNRTDLDPRVLSNSGWGQTQIKQDAAWDTEEIKARPDGKADRGTEGWENTSQAKSSGGWGDAPSQSNQNKSGWGESHAPVSSGQEWKDTKATSWNDYKNSPSGWGGGGGGGGGGKWGKWGGGWWTTRRKGRSWMEQ
ncbi:unnamed protein product [Ranitomeya imitator]|uniref:Uncharacterized protein n=1 Tax=Ranitomeya imitator TaxID=111125 RepID=A0ABN9L4E7_9NEOB|nr:unnamed protein product [Ranitomeya imitator]